jgi:hypothetical protein
MVNMRDLLSVLVATTAMMWSMGQPSREVPLNASFELKVAESVRVAGEGVAVRFDGVTGDSRCPVDVTCVWAGDATAVVRLEKPKTKPGTFELHTMPRFGGDARYEGLVVHLEAVTPRPRTGTEIPPKDYRVTLVVRREK